MSENTAVNPVTETVNPVAETVNPVAETVNPVADDITAATEWAAAQDNSAPVQPVAEPTVAEPTVAEPPVAEPTVAEPPVKTGRRAKRLAKRAAREAAERQVSTADPAADTAAEAATDNNGSTPVDPVKPRRSRKPAPVPTIMEGTAHPRMLHSEDGSIRLPQGMTRNNQPLTLQRATEIRADQARRDDLRSDLGAAGEESVKALLWRQWWPQWRKGKPVPSAADMLAALPPAHQETTALSTVVWHCHLWRMGVNAPGRKVFSDPAQRRLFALLGIRYCQSQAVPRMPTAGRTAEWGRVLADAPTDLRSLTRYKLPADLATS